jgi:type IV secretion system protein VirB6
MASDSHLYEMIFNTVDNSLSTYVRDNATNIIASIEPTARTLYIIYVMFLGTAMLMGLIKNDLVMEIAKRTIRIGVIFTIALKIGYYNDFIGDFLWKTPDALAGYLVSGYSDSASNIQYLDGLFNKIQGLGENFFVQAHAMSSYGIPDLVFMACGGLIIIFGGALTGFAAFFLIMSKMFLAILLALGPIFVLLIMFEPTKKLFDGWIGQCLNYVFLPVLIAAGIKLIFTILETYLNAHNLITVNVAIQTIILSFIGVLVIRQLPSVASALGGGVAVSSLGAVGWTYDSVNKLARSLLPKNQGRPAAQPASQITGGSVKSTRGMPSSVYRKLTSSNVNRISK